MTVPAGCSFITPSALLCKYNALVYLSLSPTTISTKTLLLDLGVDQRLFDNKDYLTYPQNVWPFLHSLIYEDEQYYCRGGVCGFEEVESTYGTNPVISSMNPTGIVDTTITSYVLQSKAMTGELITWISLGCTLFLLLLVPIVTGIIYKMCHKPSNVNIDSTPTHMPCRRLSAVGTSLELSSTESLVEKPVEHVYSPIQMTSTPAPSSKPLTTVDTTSTTVTLDEAPQGGPSHLICSDSLCSPTFHSTYEDEPSGVCYRLHGPDESLVTSSSIDTDSDPMDPLVLVVSTAEIQLSANISEVFE